MPRVLRIPPSGTHWHWWPNEPLSAVATCAITAIIVLMATGCAVEGQRQAPPSADRSAVHDAEGAAASLAAENSTAARVIAEVLARGERVDRVSASLTLDLTRADGATARLDATLRMARPDHFRVRSTKWGFLVCDVVVRGDEVSALLSPVVREQAQSSAEATVALARVLGSLVGWHNGAVGGVTQFELVEQRDDAVVVRLAGDTATALEWTLAQSDGRPLRVRRLDGEVVTGVLTCSAHQDIDGVPLPMQLRFESAEGTIDVTVRRPRVNPPEDEHAFDVPAGAEPLHSAPPG